MDSNAITEAEVLQYLREAYSVALSGEIPTIKIDGHEVVVGWDNGWEVAFDRDSLEQLVAMHKARREALSGMSCTHDREALDRAERAEWAAQMDVVRRQRQRRVEQA